MKAKGIGTSAVVAIIVIIAIAGTGGYFVLKGGEVNSELKNKFLQDAKKLANLAINVGAGGGGGIEIQVPDNARLKFENQSVIAMIGGEEHSYYIYSDVIGTTLETGEYVLVLSFNEDEDRVEIVLQGGEGVPAPAEFEVSNLTFYPSEVEVGESVTISATVKNVGDLEGTHTVELKIDGVAEATKNVTLAGGATEMVSFTVNKNEAKSYSVLVDGVTSSFTVKKPQPEWIYITTFTAMTDYWYSTWLDLQSEPWNRAPDEFIDDYQSYDEQFTDDFYIQGNKFKIEYHVAGDYNDGICMAFIYPKGTDINYVDARPIFRGSGKLLDANQSGTYTVDAEPGEYYLVISTEYIDYWTIDIYDWRTSSPVPPTPPEGEIWMTDTEVTIKKHPDIMYYICDENAHWVQLLYEEKPENGALLIHGGEFATPGEVPTPTEENFINKDVKLKTTDSILIRDKDTNPYLCLIGAMWNKRIDRDVLASLMTADRYRRMLVMASPEEIEQAGWGGWGGIQQQVVLEIYVTES